MKEFIREEFKTDSFYVASEEDIKSGRTTDIYFVRTKRVLEAKDRKKVRVVVEVTAGRIPDDRPWGVLCGIEEVARLFEGVPVNVFSMEEGSIFRPRDFKGVRMPVLIIEGYYYDFCEFETALLGFICQETGVATRTAFVKKAAGEKMVIAFGARRGHPALSPVLDRAAYIGGSDGVSTLKGAEIIGEEPMGTMPHALILIFGDQAEAWKAFDETMSPEVPRVVLVDTFFDEKIESIRAAETLGKKLQYVRLDTPSSRRGDFPTIIREVRWELNIRGHEHVGIFVSGGLDEEAVRVLDEAGADGFGVGTYITSAPPVDFALDIVEVEGKLTSKRGKLSGRKQVWRCFNCMIDLVKPLIGTPPDCPKCNGEMKEMLKPLIQEGKIVGELPEPRVIRGRVLDQVSKLTP